MRRAAPIVLLAFLLSACGGAATPIPAATQAGGGGTQATPAPDATGAVGGAAASRPAPAPPATPAPEPTEGPTPTEEPMPTAAPPVQVELGAAADVTFVDGSTAQVGVVTIDRRMSCGSARPAAGSVFVVATVGYAATAGTVTYKPTQWLLTGASSGPILIPSAGLPCGNTKLGDGTLKTGHDTGGWIAFEAPADARDLRLRFAPGGLQSWFWVVPN